jgi:hypothetical protein
MLEPSVTAFRIKHNKGFAMLGSRTNGVLVVAGLVVFAVAQSATIGQNPAPGQPPANGQFDPAPPAGGLRPPQVTASAAAEGMMAFASPDGDRGQLVTIIDAKRSWMAVYSVDAGGERIKLLSSRPLSQDFSVQYNVTDPTPVDIQRLQTP